MAPYANPSCYGYLVGPSLWPAIAFVAFLVLSKLCILPLGFVIQYSCFLLLIAPYLPWVFHSGPSLP